jgi:cytochrome c oxidase assembly factor CtaG
MSVRALAIDWSLDGPVGAAFLALTVAIGALYLVAAGAGRRRDRRGRSWPRGRTACFLAGLAILVLDLYSGVGSLADTWLSVHMVEHMVMWVLVAPLLAAGAPVRLALYSLPRAGRFRLARWLRSPLVAALTGGIGAVTLFWAVLVLTHLPPVYGLALSNDYAHEAEHALYLFTALLVWAPLVGADPLPHRPGTRGQLACMAACMVPMGLIALWLATAPIPVYGHYLDAAGTAALRDQRIAATIMWAGCLPAFAVPALRLIPFPQRRRAQHVRSHRVAA